MGSANNQIDWDLVVKIVVPFLALIFGIIINRISERRPKLISYLGHVSAFNIDSPPMQVFTHTIVLRNVGKATAENVRVGHNILPNYNVYPNVNHLVIDLPQGGKEILFPNLVSEEQVSISYLYFPPITWDRINSYTKHDGGLAKIITVIPTPIYPKWLNRLLLLLIILGGLTVLYFLIKILTYIYKTV